MLVVAPMIKKQSSAKVSDINLSQTTVVRPSGRVRYSNFANALEAVRSWVAFGEAIRIYETTFGIKPT